MTNDSTDQDSPSPVVVSLTPSNKSSSGGSKPTAPPRPRFSESEVKAMTSKKYMDALVVPTLLKAMAAVNKQRPTDPVEFLGNYLLKCNNESAVATSATGTESDNSKDETFRGSSHQPREEKME